MKTKQNNPFSVVGTAKVQRSALDLTHVIKTAFYPGQLIPLPPIDCIPGDVHHLRLNAVVRLQPLATPVFENLKFRCYFFFIPYRILWDDWERFITRGDDGTQVVALPTFNPGDTPDATSSGLGSLWDYFGFQLGDYSVTPLRANSQPLQFPWLAYWKIYNEFFRIPEIQDPIDWLADYATDATVSMPAFRNFVRDYFTSALPEAQLGVPPALPVFGSANAQFAYTGSTTVPGTNVYNLGTNATITDSLTAINFAAAGGVNQSALDNIFGGLSAANTIDGSSFSSSDINDLRLAWQLQVWMERNARGGPRYIEQLISHYNVAPRDERLQRPEYIGGSTTDVIISEVVQTSASDTQPTPQGNLAGQGFALPRGHIGSYRVKEHGMIMALVNVAPQSTYQQGISSYWLKRTTFDYPFPEFAHLGEQGIKNAELYISNSATDDNVFGFTGIYNDYRYIASKITGQMRSGVTGSLDNWHMARNFGSTPPLATEFTSMESALSDFMRPFAVQTEPPLLGIISVGIDAMRPIPYIAEPSSIGSA